MRQKVAIFASVVLLHLVALWVMQTGLWVRITGLASPAHILLAIVPSPSPLDRQSVEPLARTTAAERTPEPRRKVFTTQALTFPIAANPSVESVDSASEKPPTTTTDAVPMNNRRTVVAAGPSGTLQVQTVDRGTVPPGPPSNEAEHLYAPEPPYPQLSARLREAGTPVLRILIGKDGLPQKVELAQSSGFPRLDAAALDAVKVWRFVPRQENGVAVEKWYLQSIPFRIAP